MRRGRKQQLPYAVRKPGEMGAGVGGEWKGREEGNRRMGWFGAFPGGRGVWPGNWRSPQVPLARAEVKETKRGSSVDP